MQSLTTKASTHSILENQSQRTLQTNTIPNTNKNKPEITHSLTNKHFTHSRKIIIFDTQQKLQTINQSHQGFLISDNDSLAY